MGFKNHFCEKIRKFHFSEFFSEVFRKYTKTLTLTSKTSERFSWELNLEEILTS